MFDADGNGYIDVDELSTIMAKLGQNLDQKQLKARIKKKYKKGQANVSIIIPNPKVY